MDNPQSRPTLAATEYARLKAEMSTKKGYARIDAAWAAAADPPPGRVSSSSGLAGLAVDTETGECILGLFQPGGHEKPFDYLCRRLAEQIGLDAAESRVTAGRAAVIE